jgi:hypothetical protein
MIWIQETALMEFINAVSDAQVVETGDARISRCIRAERSRKSHRFGLQQNVSSARIYTTLNAGKIPQPMALQHLKKIDH